MRLRAQASWCSRNSKTSVESTPGYIPVGIAASRQSVVVEVEGRRVEVTMPTSLLPLNDLEVTRGPAPRRARGSAVSTATGNSVAAPMQATVVKVAVEEGQQVAAGDLVVVLEAMKMEQSIFAHRDGVVRDIQAEAGTTVPSGHILLSVVDAE